MSEPRRTPRRVHTDRVHICGTGGCVGAGCCCDSSWVKTECVCCQQPDHIPFLRRFVRRIKRRHADGARDRTAADDLG